jgi:hypothetical protein
VVPIESRIRCGHSMFTQQDNQFYSEKIVSRFWYIYIYWISMN